MNTRVTLLAALGACLVVSASAQVSKVGTGYQFRMKYTTGKTIAYEIKSAIPVPNQPTSASMVMPVVQKVKSVEKGIAEIAIKMGPMVVNKQVMGQGQTATTRVNSLGKVVGPASSQQASFTTFPEQPIKVGGSWTSTTSLATMGPGGGNAKATYTLLGIRSEGGHQVAKIKMVISATGEMAMSGSGVGAIDVVDGQLRSMTVNLSAPNPMGKGAPMKVAVTITRK